MGISTCSEKLIRLHHQLSAIGPQLRHYADHLNAGTADGNLHFVVYQQQLAPWIATITGLLADANTLASLTLTYPVWSQATLQSMLTSLQAIQAGMAPHLAPFNCGGAWSVTKVRSLALCAADQNTLFALIHNQLT